MVNADAHRIKTPHLLEMKRGIARVALQLLVTAIREPLNGCRKRAVALPEFRRCVVNQNVVVLPEAWAFSA